MASHQELVVWRRAHALTVQIYQLRESRIRGHGSNVFEQLRRSVASIPANIAEGRGQRTKPQFRRYLDIAIASANESDSHLTLLLDLALLDPQTALDLRDELSTIRRMLLALRKTIL